jgi:hypothetical protein
MTNDKQRISALETQLADLRANNAQLRDKNAKQARIIADMRASEMKRNPHLKSVENGAGNSTVYRRDDGVDMEFVRHIFSFGMWHGCHGKKRQSSETIAEALQDWGERKNTI